MKKVIKFSFKMGVLSGVFAFLLLGFSACEPVVGGGQQPLTQDPLLKDLIKEVGELGSEFEERAKPSKVEAWVDKLIVKSQPGREMPQIALMDQGETAEYLYQRTIRKSEFKLRGQRYVEPWILIKLKDGKMGWVHQGGVRFIEPSLNELFGNQTTRSLDNPSSNAGQDFLIVPGKRVGGITYETSEEDLMRIFGPSMISHASVKTSDTESAPCTVVMEGSHNELRIVYKDANRTKVKAVYLEKEKASWHTRQGLKVGLSLSDLTKINQAPISFYGFDWQYSGTIYDWRSGKMSPVSKYFYAALKPKLAPLLGADMNAYKGDKQFSSNAQGLEKLGLHLDRLVIYLD